ncbi:MAG: RDD family protein [Acidobacteriota bacterium]|nr:RDD family protein [Pyrinomonadaceae bacterium]MDW8304612.1 RDD family protein [Acidobacteriota bacterium]
MNRTLLEKDVRTKLDCFLLRCGALAIDYIVVILPPVIGLIIARALGNDGSRLFRSVPYNLGLTVGFFIGLFNLMLLPVFVERSLGKMIAGLKIVRRDGKKAGYKEIWIRHSIGYLFSILTLGVGFLVSVFNSQGMTLHDFISNTKVVCEKDYA